MSPSTLSAAFAAGFTAVAGFLAAIAWLLSWKEGKAKDTALQKFQQQSTVAIANANARAEEAVENAARLNERALTLEKEAGEQRERAATAEREFLEFRSFLRDPRSIDMVVGDRILDWGAAGRVEFGYVAGNDEAAGTASSLARALSAHGWRIIAINAASHTPPLNPGILVEAYGQSLASVRHPMTAAEPARTLFLFLSKAVKGNPVVEVRTNPDVATSAGKDALRVFIGPKY